jgi:hypothetical protein
MKHERLLVRVEGANEAADRLRAALTLNPRYVLVDRAPQFVIRVTVADVDEVTFDGIHGELESWIATEVQALAGGSYRVHQNTGQNFDDRVVSILCNDEHFEAVQEGVVKGLDRFVQAKWAKKHRIRRWFLYPLLLFIIILLMPVNVPARQEVIRPSGSGTGGNLTAEYWIGAADGTLTNAHNLDGVANGLVVNTDGTPSQYAGATCTNLFMMALSAAGASTCGDLDDVITGTPANGDILCHNGSEWERLPRGAIGQFLRINTLATPNCEWATGPNVADQDADVANSSNVTLTALTDMAAAPAADTWVNFTCSITYKTAVTTTGIGIGLWANNAGGTAAAQFFKAKFTIGGFAAGGTDSDWVEHTAASAALIVTTGSAVNDTWYQLNIDANILTHATDSAFAIFPLFRSEINTSAVTIKEGSICTVLVNHVDS